MKFDGEKLRQLRRDRNLTLFDIAVKLHERGTPRAMPTLQAWEVGKVAPRIDDFYALLDVLGVEAEALMSPEQDDKEDRK